MLNVEMLIMPNVLQIIWKTDQCARTSPAVNFTFLIRISLKRTFHNNTLHHIVGVMYCDERGIVETSQHAKNQDTRQCSSCTRGMLIYLLRARWVKCARVRTRFCSNIFFYFFRYKLLSLSCCITICCHNLLYFNKLCFY